MPCRMRSLLLATVPCSAFGPSKATVPCSTQGVCRAGCLPGQGGQALLKSWDGLWACTHKQRRALEAKCEAQPSVCLCARNVLAVCVLLVRHKHSGGAAGWPCCTCRMFEKAASLITQLHQQGVAHCDIKMDNLLLLDGELMLSDFSEAVAFMRPEQAVLHESR